MSGYDRWHCIHNYLAELLIAGGYSRKEHFEEAKIWKIEGKKKRKKRKNGKKAAFEMIKREFCGNKM